MERIELYTDGACRGNQNTNNIGSWGAFMKYKEFTHEISGGERNTTNNIMELKGCIEGLKSIHDKSIPIIVYLDSAYVLNGITNWIKSWKQKGFLTAKKQPVANKELWIELDELKSKFRDIRFEKVKGHSDCLGNIQADRLCNKYMNRLYKEYTDRLCEEYVNGLEN